MELNFPQIEEKILKFWAENKIFEKSLKKPAPRGDYVFYDGPPFATGTPHYGHIVASLMKDVVPRFWTMRGYRVLRRWGWDCHGLPVENLVEAELKISNKKDIEEKIGVRRFNELCRASVLRYADVWKKIIPRIGRWVDMENDYKTMEPDYMESIWWVFKTLFEKGLIYEGYKSMHICPRCQTTLSNFEVTQNYKDIKDFSAILKFELIGEPDVYILAWTTTPWTLPGNAALAINENIRYVKARGKNSENKEETYILAEANLERIFSGLNYKLLTGVKAKELIGRKYKPLFNYYSVKDFKNIYTIQAADFVATEDGTGVVHIAPAFGEDDLNLAKEKNLPIISNVSVDGLFKPEVRDFAGLEVKPFQNPQQTDRKIIEYLQNKRLVFKAEEFLHSYPFCWRCDTPLLNYAADSWFVKVTAIKNKIIKNNQKVHWTPGHIKEGRFGKWLENAKDWAISRQRYWGTPLPVWKCRCGEIKIIGSIGELEKLSRKKIEDLHKHIVDGITFDCWKCGSQMKRIPDVLDCWFESGSMPYAQIHYPFENKKWFEKNFPAAFVAEGVDQTRGWFYTLMVLAAALFGKPAFKNVIVNGIVLAEDGAKMSKRLKNYPEPEIIIDKYGADALRYYLLTSPVMEAENLNFSETGVKESLQKTVILLYNVLNFYLMYETGKRPAKPKVKNILDKWILTKLNLLNQEIAGRMEEYDLVGASRPIAVFIGELSTWYLRCSRERFKDGDRDGINALGFVLLEFSKILAPFMPFIAEEIYQKIGGQKESVHLCDFPQSNPKLIDKGLEEKMAEARNIVAQTFAERALAGIKIRQPLASLKIKNQKAKIKNEPELLDLIKEEVNVKEIVFDGKVKKEVELNTEISEDLEKEGEARELIRNFRDLRKKLALGPADKVSAISSTIAALPLEEKELLKEIGAEKYTKIKNEEELDVDIKKEVKLGEDKYYIGIKK